MTKECVTFNEVVFLYDSSSLPVFEGLSVRLGVGWTGIIGPNGSGKTTFMRLACGELIPLGGSVTLPDEAEGTMMVFKTYDRISYGLIMEATDAIHILDAVRNPI